jgi:hypothetical protein
MSGASHVQHSAQVSWRYPRHETQLTARGQSLLDFLHMEENERGKKKERKKERNMEAF